MNAITVKRYRKPSGRWAYYLCDPLRQIINLNTWATLRGAQAACDEENSRLGRTP